MDNLRVMFLSKYADATSDMVFEDLAERNYANYHIAFRESIQKLFNNLSVTHCINDIMEKSNDIDFVISLYNRFPVRNSEIFISSLCEYYHIPYLGATPNIRAIAEDKHIAKGLASALGIPTAQWFIVSKKSQIPFQPPFNAPYFIKPRFGASSQNIDETCICDSWNAAKNKIKNLIEDGYDVIIEKFIDGVFYSVPAFATDKIIISPPYILKTNKKGNVITYKQKRAIESGMIREFCTRDDLTFKLMEYSKLLYSNLMPLDYARFDFIVEKNTQQIFFLEFNICCNLSPRSGYVQTCIHNNIVNDYDELIHLIIFNSLKRQNLI